MSVKRMSSSLQWHESEKAQVAQNFMNNSEKFGKIVSGFGSVGLFHIHRSFLLSHFVRYTCRLKKEIDHFERGREGKNTVELEQGKCFISDGEHKMLKNEGFH